MSRNHFIVAVLWLSLLPAPGLGTAGEPAEAVDSERPQGMGSKPVGTSDEQPTVAAGDTIPGGKAVSDLTANAATVFSNIDVLLALLDSDGGLGVAEDMVRGIRESRVSPARQRAYGRFFQYVEGLLRQENPRIPRHEALRLLYSCLYFPEIGGGFVYPTCDIRGLKELLEVYLWDRDPAVRTMALDGLVGMGFAQPCLAEGMIDTVTRYLEWETETLSDQEKEAQFDRLHHIRETMDL